MNFKRIAVLILSIALASCQIIPPKAARATPTWLAPAGISDLLSLDPTNPLTLWNNHNAYEILITVGGSTVDYLPNAYHAIYTGCASDGNEGISTTITQNVTANSADQTVTVAAIQAIVPGSNIYISDGSNQEIVTVDGTNPGANTITGIFTKSHSSGVAITGACDPGSGTGQFSANELLGVTANPMGATPPTFIDGSGYLSVLMNENGVPNTTVHVDAIIYDDESINASNQTPPNEIGAGVYYQQQVCQQAHGLTHPVKCIVTPQDDLYQESQASAVWPNIQCTSSSAGWNNGITNYDGTNGRCSGFNYLIPLMSQNLESSGASGKADIIDIQDQTLQPFCYTDCTELFQNSWQETHSVNAGTTTLHGIGTHGGSICYDVTQIEGAFYSADIFAGGPNNGGSWYNYQNNSGGKCAAGYTSRAQETDSFILWALGGYSPAPSPYYAASPQVKIGTAAQSNASGQSVTFCYRNCQVNTYPDGYEKFGFNQAGYLSSSHPTGSTQGYIQSYDFVASIPVANVSLSAVAGKTNFKWKDGQTAGVKNSDSLSPQYDNFVWQWAAGAGNQEVFTLTAFTTPQTATIYFEHTCAPVIVTASLSDSSAPTQSLTISEPTDGTEYDGNVPITFGANSWGATATITVASGVPYNTGSCSGSGTVGIAALGMSPASASFAGQAGNMFGGHK